MLPSDEFKVETPFLGSYTPPPETANDTLGYLRITLGKKEIKEQINAVFFKYLVMATAFLMFGTFITYYLARRITQPLNRLIKGISDSRKDGVFHQLPVEGKNEIGNLAIAFNRLSATVEKRDKEKKQLEDKLWQAQKMEAIGTLGRGHCA